MSRRQVGLGALNRAFESQAQYLQVGSTITNQNVADLTNQLQSFQSALQTFATRHANEIRSNPHFRSEFARMCTAIGVDPLVGSTKDKNTGKSSRGMLGWGVLGVGEFWISVATRVVALCRRTRGSNGGFISVSEVTRILAEEDKRARVKDSVEISEDDIVRSISALAPLGPGVSVVTLPSGARYIRSIPKELNPDQAVVLEVAGVMGGCVSVGLLRVNLRWEEERAKSVLEELVAEGMVWVDDAGMEREYWIPRGITEL